MQNCYSCNWASDLWAEADTQCWLYSHHLV